MKKIGFVDYYLDEWHANNYPGWINALNCGYKVTHAWAELDYFSTHSLTTARWCEKYGVKQCATIEELCEACDVIMILAPSDPDKHLGYAEAVLKYGKPTYIDKTFAPDYETAVKIFDLAQKHNTPFFSTSALRFADELASLKDGDNYIITGGGSNFPEYCIHMIEMVVKLLEDKIARTSITRQGGQCFCSLTTEAGKKATLVYTPALPFSVACDKSDGDPVYTVVSSDFFANLMKDIVRFFEEKTVSFDVAQTLEVIRVRDMLLKQ